MSNGSAQAPGYLVWLGAFSVNVTVFGLMYPHGLPLFSISLALYCLGFLWSKRSIRIPVISAYYLLLALFLIAYATTTGIFDRPRNDLIDGVGVTILLVLLYSTLSGTEDVRRFQESTAILLWFSGSLVAVVGLWKLYALSQGIVLERFVTDAGIYRFGTSLQSDYNFYALAQIISLIGGSYLMQVRGGALCKVALLLTGPLLILNVLFSGSRRGLIVLGVLIAGGLLLALPSGLRRLTSVFSRRNWLHSLQVAVGYLLVLMLIGASAHYLYASLGMGNVRLAIERLFTLEDIGRVATTRTAIWAFGVRELYSSGVWELMAGDGFDYLGRFATRFSPEVSEFTPHNMFIAATLSGGLITLVTLVWLLGRSTVMYIRHRKEVPLLLGFIVVSAPFALTSLHLIFSFPFFLILVLFPLCPGLMSAAEARRRPGDTVSHGTNGVVGGE